MKATSNNRQMLPRVFFLHIVNLLKSLNLWQIENPLPAKPKLRNKEMWQCDRVKAILSILRVNYWNIICNRCCDTLSVCITSCGTKARQLMASSLESTGLSFAYCHGYIQNIQVVTAAQRRRTREVNLRRVRDHATAVIGIHNIVCIFRK